MLAATHDWSADHCRLPTSSNNDSSAAEANIREFVVGRWAITVAECGDNMLRLAIASLANPANPIKLATLPDQDMSTVTVLAANSSWRSPTAANKRKRPCQEKNENEERTANAKRCRVEKNEDEEKEVAPRGRPVTHTRPLSPPPSVVEEAVGFSCLPDEVKLHVFAMLPPMALLRTLPLVSREWCALTHDEALWRSLYARHIGGSSPSPSTTAPSAPSLYEPSPHVPTRRRQHSTPATSAPATSTTWRASTSSVLRHLKSAFADLRRSLHDLAERQRRESEARTSLWLTHTVEWMVDGGHAPLLAAFLRDVARFAPACVIRATLAADRQLLLGAAKSGHTGAVTTLVAFGADLGQAMVLATMNRDAAGIASLFRAYAHIKTVLCAEYRRQQSAMASATATLTQQQANHGRRLFALVAGVRDAMRTCMNVASVARDRDLLEMLANLCASDADLREAHEFAHFVKFEGPFSARGRRRSQVDHDDEEDSEEEYDDEEGEDSDDDDDDDGEAAEM